MPITPADIANVRFSKEMRGYNMDEVDAFLEKVEEDLVIMIEESAALRAQVVGQGRHREPETGPIASVAMPDWATPTPTPKSQPDIQLTKILGLATETAERHVTQAKLEADQILSEAKERARALLQQSNDQAAARVADAEMQAAQIVQQARQERVQAVGELEVEVEGLEKRVEQLVALDVEYRTKLEAYMASHLASVSRGPLV